MTDGEEETADPSGARDDRLGAGHRESKPPPLQKRKEGAPGPQTEFK
jgi:hypothetical protein